MKYIEDINFKYKEKMILGLRQYNKKFTGEKEQSEEYFYAVEGDKLLGAFYTGYSWDWVGTREVSYEDVFVLKNLVGAVKKYYREKAVGIKLFTEERSRVQDFMEVGFTVGGETQGSPKTSRYFYLKNTQLDSSEGGEIDIIVSEDKIDRYHTQLQEKIQKKEDIEIMFTALEDEEFVGGVYGRMDEDSMYVAYLFVDDKYRGHGVGRELMMRIEERARNLKAYNITLGTVEFQARKFYEKLGYGVTLVKENDPRGYDSYSMNKFL